MKLDAPFQVFVLDMFYFPFTKACCLQLNMLDKNNVSRLKTMFKYQPNYKRNSYLFKKVL